MFHPPQKRGVVGILTFIIVSLDQELSPIKRNLSLHHEHWEKCIWRWTIFASEDLVLEVFLDLIFLLYLPDTCKCAKKLVTFVLKCYPSNYLSSICAKMLVRPQVFPPYNCCSSSNANLKCSPTCINSCIIIKLSETGSANNIFKTKYLTHL